MQIVVFYEIACDCFLYTHEFYTEDFRGLK